MAIVILEAGGLLTCSECHYRSTDIFKRCPDCHHELYRVESSPGDPPLREQLKTARIELARKREQVIR